MVLKTIFILDKYDVETLNLVLTFLTQASIITTAARQCDTER